MRTGWHGLMSRSAKRIARSQAKKHRCHLVHRAAHLIANQDRAAQQPQRVVRTNGSVAQGHEAVWHHLRNQTDLNATADLASDPAANQALPADPNVRIGREG